MDGACSFGDMSEPLIDADTSVEWRIRKERIMATQVDDELVLLDRKGGVLFSLAGTGRDVWERLGEAKPLAIIVRDLAASYDAPAQDVRADLQAFIGELAAADLIEKACEP